MNATTCPVNPPGHDWNNSLTCHWCSETRTPGEALLSGLASRRGGDETSARLLLNAHAAGVLAGAVEAAEVIHQRCHRDPALCAGCQTRADILDVLSSVARVLGEKTGIAETGGAV